MTSLPIFTRSENKSLYWLQMAQQAQMSDEYRRETERLIRDYEAGSIHQKLTESMCVFLCKFVRQQVQSTGHALSELILRRSEPLSTKDRLAIIDKLTQWQAQHQTWAKEMYDIEVRTTEHPEWSARSTHHAQIDSEVSRSIGILIASYKEQGTDSTRRPRRSRCFLTDKQLEAIQVVGQHHGNFAAAARALQKDRKTVEEHYRTALKKLSAANEAKKPPPPEVPDPCFAHT